tara:strand:+ start:511 stop:789 length:279 start_codon:yes stop_codon:yes gene_type:complete
MEIQFENLIKDALTETGESIQRSTSEVAFYAAERTAILSTLVGLPGYAMAVEAERDNIIAFAGLKASEKSRESRIRFLGIIQGALFMAAGLI